MTSKGTKRSLFSFGSKSHWVVRLIFPEFFLSWKNTGHFPWNEFTAGFSQLPEEKWWCGAVKSRGRQPSNPKDPTPSWKCFREITSWNPNCCAFFNIFMARFKKKRWKGNKKKFSLYKPFHSQSHFSHLFLTKLMNFRETLLYGSPGDLRKSPPKSPPHLQSRGSDFKRLYRFLGFFQDFNFKDVYWRFLSILIIVDRSTRWLWKQPIWNIWKETNSLLIMFRIYPSTPQKKKTVLHKILH